LQGLGDLVDEVELLPFGQLENKSQIRPSAEVVAIVREHQPFELVLLGISQGLIQHVDDGPVDGVELGLQRRVEFDAGNSIVEIDQ
jgi:hypothetical protein